MDVLIEDNVPLRVFLWNRVKEHRKRTIISGRFPNGPSVWHLDRELQLVICVWHWFFYCRKGFICFGDSIKSLKSDTFVLPGVWDNILMILFT